MKEEKPFSLTLGDLKILPEVPKIENDAYFSEHEENYFRKPHDGYASKRLFFPKAWTHQTR